MDYARVLLTVLWDDFSFLLMGVVMMAALLIPASFVIYLILGRVYDGVPFRIQARGTLYGWFSGVIVFVGIFLVATLLNSSIHWDVQADQAAGGLLLVSYAALTVVAAAQAFQYVEHHYNRREVTLPPSGSPSRSGRL